MTPTAVEQLREDEAGVVDRAAVDEAAAELAAVPEPVVEIAEDENGAFQLLVGGKQVTTTKVRLLGGGIECAPPEGGWLKGTKHVLRVEVVVTKKAFVDELDGKTRAVIGCRDEAGLAITGVSLA